MHSSTFHLPTRLAAKAAADRTADDDAFFATLDDGLRRVLADVREQLAAERRAPGGTGTAVLLRDQNVHRLAARLRTLERYGLDLCLGRMVALDGTRTYVGRLGLLGPDGRQLLVDWRSPAAAAFFGATHAEPMGLASRRRYRWTDGRITDYWDEVFGPAGTGTSPDDQSAFIAELGSSRSPRMRDVLGTIAADQDAVIRAGSQRTLVVDGGPGTGKTVVALHRAAYLLYSDPRLGPRRGGVLFVGPSRPYLDYVADVLPSLGEDGVRTCTLRDLVAEGATAADEPDPTLARLKASADLVRGLAAGVRFYEQPPTASLRVDTDWGSARLGPADWAQAFDSPDPGTPHNPAREAVWAELVEILADRFDDDVPPADLERALRSHRELRRVFTTAWPLVDAVDLVADLWTVPAFLRLCAPWLSRDEVSRLQRSDGRAWTTSDLPLLDAARHLLGDVDSERRTLVARAERSARRAEMDRVVDHLVTDDDSEEHVMSMLRVDDLQDALLADPAPSSTVDPLAGPFAHIVVDEAQELTDAQWQMLLRRCPSHSLTVAGDRAQARQGFTESWTERLARVGLPRVESRSLRVNYRTPAEIMAEAEPVIRAALPDANVPTSVRSTGRAVRHGSVSDLPDVLAGWLNEHDEGIACVIATCTVAVPPRVRCLTPSLAKGLEFDLVVLVDPASFGVGDSGGITAAVDRYVAMTRATQDLVVLES